MAANGAAATAADGDCKRQERSSCSLCHRFRPEAMEDLLPHEIAERELEMQEAVEIQERWEELRMGEDEVEKTLSIEELAVECQQEL
ncbi:DNA-directed RNA polymerase II subunit RPB1 [Hordeum vulgare]|nr:DNA-directed RNA polymerase II subunit RPB1 [Hordeum vulgare]KAE8814696.1 DNA-directed RNA polymerase II subunit RPB1 [Hordeum vulgare]KAI4973283.1 hypothetical protein ZWY2020_028991 [Hordeum vulgare]